MSNNALLINIVCIEESINVPAELRFWELLPLVPE